MSAIPQKRGTRDIVHVFCHVKDCWFRSGSRLINRVLLLLVGILQLNSLQWLSGAFLGIPRYNLLYRCRQNWGSYVLCSLWTSNNPGAVELFLCLRLSLGRVLQQWFSTGDPHFPRSLCRDPFLFKPRERRTGKVFNFIISLLFPICLYIFYLLYFITHYYLHVILHIYKYYIYKKTLRDPFRTSLWPTFGSRPTHVLYHSIKPKVSAFACVKVVKLLHWRPKSTTCYWSNQSKSCIHN